MKAPSLPSLRSMILSMEEEKKKMCFLIILLLFFSPSIAIMRPYSLIKLTGVLFSDFFLFVFWVLSAVSSFTHTKTRRKKIRRRIFFYKHTDFKRNCPWEKSMVWYLVRNRAMIYLWWWFTVEEWSMLFFYTRMETLYKYIRRGIIQKLMTAFGKEIKRTHILKIMLQNCIFTAVKSYVNNKAFRVAFFSFIF